MTIVPSFDLGREADHFLGFVVATTIVRRGANEANPLHVDDVDDVLALVDNVTCLGYICCVAGP